MQRRGLKRLVQLDQKTISSLWLECEQVSGEDTNEAKGIGCTLCDHGHDLFYRKTTLS